MHTEGSEEPSTKYRNSRRALEDNRIILRDGPMELLKKFEISARHDVRTAVTNCAAERAICYGMAFVQDIYTQTADLSGITRLILS